MLVLTRKTGQKLMIGNEVVVTILETKGDAVKIGIDAPRSVSIYREEIYDEIVKTNQSASQEKAGAADLDQALNLMKKPPGGSKGTDKS